MALGSKYTHARTELGRGSISRVAALRLSHTTKKRSIIPMIAEDSVAEFRRDRGNVRSYVRSSSHKLKWTSELHQTFMRAVARLGGKDKATPKKILLQMDQEGITIAHIKSHLQMYRTGKINADGLSTTATSSEDGTDSVQFEPISKALSGKNLEEAREVHMALQMLKEGIISGAAGKETLLKGLVDFQAFKRFKTSEETTKEVVKTNEFVPAVEHRPNTWSVPYLESFLDETRTDNDIDKVEALSGRKRKAEEDIELDLTMATRSSSPKIQFPSPSTPEEATLSLGLS